MGISNPSLTDHVSNETIFSAPCVRFICDRTHSDHFPPYMAPVIGICAQVFLTVRERSRDAR